jgi:hypothetical protein
VEADIRGGGLGRPGCPTSGFEVARRSGSFSTCARVSSIISTLCRSVVVQHTAFDHLAQQGIDQRL